MDQATSRRGTIGPGDVTAAAARIAGRVRQVTLAHVEPIAIDAHAVTVGHDETGAVGHDETGTAGSFELVLALEMVQHTGTFKARGAANLAAYHLAAGTMPDAGIVIASGGNAGVAVVAVGPTGCRALHAAIEHGGPVDVPADSIAADSLGGRRASQMAYDLAVTSPTTSVLVSDEAIASARQRLWDDHRLVVEPGGATALAALLSGAYVPRPGGRVAVVLCGANTDPSDLAIR
ncbi:phenylserine dehydratase [mine drainage metagenome]|uniref:Phenylserine dehydratase n=1 Tax=mine drainage metagenome TaxID=410659 RepID=A0A1J5R415_9ZZZZ